MKRICKGSTPKALQDYIRNNPDDTWEQMSGDNTRGGSQAARECRDQAIRDQKGLCAYCEQKISSDDTLHRRIEHFHPKSDKTGTHNWSLDWKNMLAVCDGGSSSSQEERIIHPLPANLSCDAHKDRMVQTGKLPISCEGHLLNPLAVPAFPNLFVLEKDTGYFKPDETACANAQISGYEHETISISALIGYTIETLNLNCDRLAAKRRLIIFDIDRNKKRLRESGVSQSEMSGKLISRYFRKEWPEFFTTLRCCLGSAAEDYLESINFKG
jgi:uncharacterized protein (TIGR02646 family)